MNWAALLAEFGYERYVSPQHPQGFWVRYIDGVMSIVTNEEAALNTPTFQHFEALIAEKERLARMESGSTY